MNTNTLSMDARSNARHLLEREFFSVLDRVVPADAAIPVSASAFLEFLSDVRQLPADRLYYLADIEVIVTQSCDFVRSVAD